MSTVTLLVVIVVVVVVVAVLGVAASMILRKRRSERLREEFGPEYERTLHESDDPDKAEADLRRREKQRKKIQLRALDERERVDYQNRWDGVQREFVDDPGRAVEQADRLVVDVMSARGYPAEDVDRRADDLSVDYPVITQRYREAREISRSHEAGRADTEDLRGAVTSYRELVYALLDDSDARDGDESRGERNGVLPRGDRDDRGRDDRDRDADRVRDTGGAQDRDHLADRNGDRGRDRLRDDVANRHVDRGRDDHVRDDLADRDGDRGRDRVRDDRDGDRGRDGMRDDRDRGGVRDDRGGVQDDRGRDGLRDDRDGVRDDRGRDGLRDEQPGRDGDNDGRRMRDVVKDKVTGGPDDRHPDDRHLDGPADRGGDRGRDRLDDRDGDHDRDGRRVQDVVRDKAPGPDARDDRHPDRDGDRVDDRDGDHDRDGRRLRDVVKDKVTGRDSERGPDSREPAGGSDGQAWERGKHAFRNEDEPRRETTT